jgi:hypothetical protein
MKRRQFIAGFAGTIVATLGTTRAQQTGKIRRVGFLSGRARPDRVIE